MIVNMDRARNIKSITGEISPRIVLDTTPSVDLQRAERKALATVGKKYRVSEEHLEVLSSELSIYNPVLLGHQMNRNFLVWKVVVKSTQIPIRQFMLIDAKTGITLLSFNQIDAALYREIYDNDNGNNSWDLPGYGPVRIEDDPATGIQDVDDAYTYLGDTYDFYMTYHGRDSIDDAGMNLIATVRYCDYLYYLFGLCPYPNAYWDGTQMVFGEGFAAADDVVGHELTHGVTENESALFYYMQSGAINESFSDIWGEFIDQWNGKGDDSPKEKWLIGEDLPASIGVIRNMKNPPAYKDPDSMLSSYYYCKAGDNGGVHTNSGVNNKAAYLMTDGGTFNGYTINPLDMEKVAKIYYEVQTNLLTSGADYQDLADALYQACVNLIGTDGIESSDCDEVLKAVNSVHMYALPDKCKNIDVPLCNAGVPLEPPSFFDDMENTGSGKWISGAAIGSNEWYYPQDVNPYEFDATYTTSGEYNLWGYDYGGTYDAFGWLGDGVSDYYIAMASSVTLPGSGNIFMHFNHAYEFEYGTLSGKTYYFDGGILEYSIDDGAWQDAKDLIIINGYDGKIYLSTMYPSDDSPLAGRNAFVGSSHGYISTKLDLSSLVGQSVRFRFRIGTDYMGDSWGWFIDDVRIYTCDAADPSTVSLTSPSGGDILKPNEVTNITWTGPSKMAYATLKYSLDKGATWKTIEKNLTGTEYPWNVPLQPNNKKGLIKITAFDSKGISLGSSTVPFSIEVLGVTYPNGGETLTSGDDMESITWTTNTTKTDVAKVQLFYTKNGGTTWISVYTYEGENPETHPWTVPDVGLNAKTKCKVKVVLRDALNNIIGSDLSDAIFTIQPGLR